MRVTVIHRYFWPDPVPYATMLRSIATRWAGLGHHVRVVTAKSARRRPECELPVATTAVVPEAWGGRAQLANLLVFPLGVAARLLRSSRAEVIMCSTAPQVTLGAVISTVAKLQRSRFIYHCMDIHPEIGVLSGDFANPVIRRVLRWIDTGTMRRASRIIVLSEDMKRAVIDRDPALRSKTVIMNNFALPAEPDSPTSIGEPDPGRLRVVFTGNLGRFQGLEHVIRAAHKVRDDVSMEVIFMGQGRAAPDLKKLATALPSRPNVHFHFLPQGPVSEARALMRTAHVGIVSLTPGIVKYAYPSKTATYAQEGLPLLVICDPGCELADTIRTHHLGWAIQPGDESAMTRSFEIAAEELTDGRLANRGAIVKAYADQEFDEEMVLQRWEALLNELEQERAER